MGTGGNMKNQEAGLQEAAWSPQSQAAQLWGRLEQGTKPESRGKDGFPVYPDDPLVELQRLLSAYLKQTVRTTYFWKLKPEKFPAGSKLLALEPKQKAQV